MARKNMPLYKNLTWVRPATPPQESLSSGGGSLLTRIEPASDSLLRRLAPSDSEPTLATPPGTIGDVDQVAKPSRELTTPEREAEAFAERLIRESEAVMVRNAQRKAGTLDADSGLKTQNSAGSDGVASGNGKVCLSMHLHDFG